MNLFNAWIKKRFGIKSPSAMINGYEYDYLLSEKDDNKKESEDKNNNE